MEAVNYSLIPDWQRSKPWAHLQAWYAGNEPESKYIYADAMVNQFMFIRDEAMSIFKDKVKSIEAISHHTSKSVKLPVYRILLPGVEIIARCNFHDWKVSVMSSEPLEFSRMLFIDEGRKKISHVDCEGFEYDWVYDCYHNDRKKFTVELQPSEHYMWAFLFMLNEQL